MSAQPDGRARRVAALKATHSNRQYWDEELPEETSIYELTLKQIFAILKQPQLDKQTRTRYHLAVLRWQGKFESGGERNRAFGELVSMSRGGADEPDALLADVADSDKGSGSDPVPSELGTEEGHS